MPPRSAAAASKSRVVRCCGRAPAQMSSLPAHSGRCVSRRLLDTSRVHPPLFQDVPDDVHLVKCVLEVRYEGVGVDTVRARVERRALRTGHRQHLGPRNRATPDRLIAVRCSLCGGCERSPCLARVVHVIAEASGMASAGNECSRIGSLATDPRRGGRLQLTM